MSPPPRSAERSSPARRVLRLSTGSGSAPAALAAALALLHLPAAHSQPSAPPAARPSPATAPGKKPAPPLRPDPALLSEARQALLSGVPEVALAKLSGLPPETRSDPAVRLIELEALARGPEPARALEVPAGGLENSAEAAFWQGRALAALARWPEALLKFQRSAELGHGPEALLGAADALRAIGAPEAALATLGKALSSLPSSPDPEQARLAAEALIRQAEIRLETGDIEGARSDTGRLAGLPGFASAARLIEGRLALKEKNFDSAAAAFRSVLESEGPGGRLTGPAALGLAKALQLSGQRDEARKALSAFIENHTAHPALAEAFAAYDALTTADTGPADPALRAWSRGPNVPRKLYAVFYAARAESRSGQDQRAVKRLEDYLKDFPDAPMAGAALAELARLQLALGNDEDAAKAAAAARRRAGAGAEAAWPAFLEGRALFALGRFAGAARAFAAAAASPALEEKALFNSAICAIRSSDYQEFLRRYAAFSARFPESEGRRDLLVEQGLFQARNRDPDAAKTLTVFLRDFPGHPRAGEARLALAEIEFRKDPERAAVALDMLGMAREAGLSGELAARADVLELWIASALPGVSPDEAARLGRAMLARHPSGPAAYLIRMKLGAIFYGMEDYTSARDQFQLAAAEAGGSEAEDEAALLAGLAAMRMMDPQALDAAAALFQEVAAGGGARAGEARRFLAEIQSLLGRHTEAAALCDQLLAANPPPRDRAEILLLKANSLKEAGAAGDPAQIVKALPLYDEAASSAAAYPALRNEALFRKGRALEALGQTDKALAAYFDVLRTPMSGALDPEYFWFYKAGFEAARLLEERRSYESAVAVYSQLADADGPGAKDAARRMEQLRLRHFIWSE